jgi:tetratricopeptide (TPR) repeat protein
MALALVSLAQKIGMPEHGAAMAGLAEPGLKAALSRWPDDVPAEAALAAVHTIQGRPSQAARCYESALNKAPESEVLLAKAAELAEGTGKRDEAREYWRRFLTINPHLSGAHLALGRLYMAEQDWPQAADAINQALRLNPAEVEARKQLIICYLRLGDEQRSLAELEVLMAASPDGALPLRMWYAAQKNQK